MPVYVHVCTLQQSNGHQTNAEKPDEHHECLDWSVSQWADEWMTHWGAHFESVPQTACFAFQGIGVLGASVIGHVLVLGLLSEQ